VRFDLCRHFDCTNNSKLSVWFPFPTSMDSKISPTHSMQIVEEKSSIGREQNLYNADIDTTGIDERKLIRKVDIRLVPWFSLLYLLSFLDRTSIGK
jgi:hypothetical protein